MSSMYGHMLFCQTRRSGLMVALFIIIHLFASCTPKRRNFFEVSNSPVIGLKTAGSREISRNKPKRVLIDLQTHKLVAIDSIIVSPKFVFLERRHNSDIGAIDKVVVSGKFIFVLDQRISQALFVFESDGKFRYKIDKTSNATAIDDFCVVNNQIYLLNKRVAILTYDVSSGECVGAVPLPFYANNISINDHSLLRFDFYTSGSLADTAAKHWVVNLDVREAKVKFLDMRKHKDDTPPRVQFKFSFSSDDKNHLVKDLSDTLFEIQKDTIKPLYKLDLGRHSIPKNELSGMRLRGNRIYDKLVEMNYVSGIENIRSTDQWFYLSCFVKSSIVNLFINKDTNRLIQFNQVIDDKYRGSIRMIPVGVTRDQFIYVLNPSAIVSRLSSGSSEITDKQPAKNFERSFIGRLNDKSNPVLVFSSPL